jgi:lysophospholipase L1-like esterase
MGGLTRWRFGLMLLCSTCLWTCAPTPRPTLAPDGQAIVRIVFVGDSLVHRAQVQHAFLTRVRQRLERSMPGRTFDVVDAGVNGNRIADIRDRLQSDVLDRHPSAVVLYWDSDVSDVDEAAMSAAEVQATRAAYTRALDEVLGRLASSQAHVIVSGPTLLGERPHGRNPKDEQADAYRRINRRAAVRFGATYVNTRRTFQEGRPPAVDPTVDRGFLTEDGEHLNERGARVAADMFVRSLEAWLHTRGTTPAGR